MVFNHKKEVDLFLKSLVYLKEGSQGACYLDVKEGIVYKFFHDFEEGYEDFNKEQLLQFQDIKTSTFLFPFDVMIMNEKVIGYLAKYVLASNLYELNPLNVSLDKLIKTVFWALQDIEILSKKGVHIYDMMYNILLGKRIYVIDTVEYTRRGEDYKKLYRENVSIFNLEIMYFLIDGYFEKVILDDTLLKAMYLSRGYDMSIIEFIEVFRKRLAMILGSDVNQLGMAQSLMNERVENHLYQRSLVLK